MTTACSMPASSMSSIIVSGGSNHPKASYSSTCVCESVMCIRFASPSAHTPPASYISVASICAVPTGCLGSGWLFAWGSLYGSCTKAQQPFRAHFKTHVRVSEADERGAELKETNVEHRPLHAHTTSVVPGFEMRS